MNLLVVSLSPCVLLVGNGLHGAEPTSGDLVGLNIRFNDVRLTMIKRVLAATIVAAGLSTSIALAETDIVKTKTFTAAPETTTTVVSPGAVEEHSSTTTIAPGFEERTSTTTSTPVMEEKTVTTTAPPVVEEQTTTIKKHHRHFILF
jgi:hypothetical protein